MRSAKGKTGSGSFEVIAGGRRAAADGGEARIEARLERMSQEVDRVILSLPAALFAEQSPTRRLLQELVIKASALRWAVRTAKHAPEGVREKMWENIEQSVTVIEKSLEVLPQMERFQLRAQVGNEERAMAARPYAF